MMKSILPDNAEVRIMNVFQKAALIIFVLFLMATITGCGDKRKIEEQQKKCSDQAKQVVNADQWGWGWKSTYNNHYNQKLNKCLVRIDRFKLSNDSMQGRSVQLLDAFERRSMASYFEGNGNIQNCRTDKKCESFQEFWDYTKPFMQE